MSKSELSVEEMEYMYTECALSCSQIGELAGISRQGVWKALRVAGVDTAKGGPAFRYKLSCAVCGVEFERSKSRVRVNAFHYCGRGCYDAMLRSGGTAESSYGGGRLGQLARWKAAVLYGGELPEGSVVHHENRDRADNGEGNLVIFKNQGDHMRWHRGILVDFIWPEVMSKGHEGYGALGKKVRLMK